MVDSQASPFRVKILTPSTGVSRIWYTKSLMRLIVHFARCRVFEDQPSQAIDYDTFEGSGISANRESLIEGLLADDWSHVLFIDEDMVFAAHTLHVLASRRLPIVGCNYPVRTKGGGFTTLSKDRRKRIVTNPDSTGLDPCFYTGFGFCLLERSIFERMQRPWFLIGYNLTTHKYTTEDAAFAVQLEEQLPDVTWYVDHDASKLVSHIGNYNYTWQETCEEILKEQTDGNSLGSLQSPVSVGESP